LPKVIAGVGFHDGIEVIKLALSDRPITQNPA
jgi:hypothetical protein